MTTTTDPTTHLDFDLELDFDALADDLTGRAGGLRPSKPTSNGLHQYLWRMARFHAGYDTSMPVTAAWWLQDYLDDQGIDASVSGVTDDRGTELTSALEDVVDDLLVRLGENPTRGAARWNQTGAF